MFWGFKFGERHYFLWLIFSESFAQCIGYPGEYPRQQQHHSTSLSSKGTTMLATVACQEMETQTHTQFFVCGGERVRLMVPLSYVSAHQRCGSIWVSCTIGFASVVNNFWGKIKRKSNFEGWFLFWSL